MPAVAYYDKNSTASGSAAIGALKFAFVDGTGAWNIEMVDFNYGTAACGSANSFCIGAPNAANGSVAQILSLAFKSDGSPAIAYVYGASAATANSTKQIRFAERTPMGTWNVSVAFQSSTNVAASNVATAGNVDPMKAVNLVFDASDRPHITFAFYAQTITNSQTRYLYRATPSGTWSSSSITAAVSGAGTITALGQGNNQGGMIYCGSSGPILISHVSDAAAGAGKAVFSRCTALTNGECTTWSVINMQTGCGTSASCFGSLITNSSNGGQRTDLILNSSSRPVIGYYNTTGAALYVRELPNSCDQAQPSAAGSWGNPITVASGSAGVAGFSLAASSTEYFVAHGGGASGTSNLTLNKCTSSTCSFFATGPTLEAGAGLIGNEGVKALYDASNEMVYVSYARLPSAGPGAYGNDIILGAASPVNLVNAATTVASLNVIDNMTNFFPSTAMPVVSAARAPNGNVGFSYIFADSTAADIKLYYGIRGGSDINPAFGSQFVTSHQESTGSATAIGNYPSLVFDTNSNPAIAFYNGVNQSLQIARSFNGGVSFSISDVEDSATNNIGQFPSLARSGNTIGISYYDVTNTALKFARSSGAGWLTFTVDGGAGAGGCGNTSADAGSFSKLLYTSDGRPVIFYKSDNFLRIAYAAESTSSKTYNWTCTTLDSSGNNRGNGVDAFVDETDTLHVVHFDGTNGQIRYGKCSTPANLCAGNSAHFNFELVNAIGTTTIISTKPQVVVSSSGKVYISYYSASFQGLGISSRSAGSASWDAMYVDTNNNGTSLTSMAGQYSTMILNDDDYPMIFYRSIENWLKYFSIESD